MITATGNKGLDMLCLAILTISVALSIYATVAPQWLQQEQVAFLPKTSYGLFKMCVTPPFGDHKEPSCSDFPGKDVCNSNNKDSQNFCNTWKMSRFSMIGACIAGGSALLALFGGMLMGKADEGHDDLGLERQVNPTLSNLVNIGLGLHTLLQLLTMSIMARMLNSANKQIPIYQTQYGSSFVTCTASWVTNIFLSGLVFAATYMAGRGGMRGLTGGYQEIGRAPQ
jgi:hypothetical protein